MTDYDFDGTDADDDGTDANDDAYNMDDDGISASMSWTEDYEDSEPEEEEDEIELEPDERPQSTKGGSSRRDGKKHYTLDSKVDKLEFRGTPEFTSIDDIFDYYGDCDDWEPTQDEIDEEGGTLNKFFDAAGEKLMEILGIDHSTDDEKEDEDESEGFVCSRCGKALADEYSSDGKCDECSGSTYTKGEASGGYTSGGNK